jgi:DHA1 family bicyclomycin/chloramphenicol resistance-like MFS transporter
MSKSIKKPLSYFEFVALMALLMSLVALAIDMMLPSLNLIGKDLGVVNENDTQWIISALFIGLASGQLFYGPLSDWLGRKPIIYISFIFFFIGCFLSITATTFDTMLAGRILQGFGVAGPRVVSMALIRDQYKGDAMAKVMSFTLTVFMLVPCFAPLIGAEIQELYDWRAIFITLLLIGIIALVWFAIRQPETLVKENRRVFSLKNVWEASVIIFTNPIAIGYTIASGIVFGAFLGYLLTVSQVFRFEFRMPEQFKYFFGLFAIGVGISAFLNGKLVLKIGMIKITQWAIRILSFGSVLFLLTIYLFDLTVDIYLFTPYMFLTLFFMGFLFGNLSSLAMEPLGKIAGIGSAIVSSLSLFISSTIGNIIGTIYTDSVIIIIIGFSVLGVISTIMMFWIERFRKII